ncbi:hypothetical protein M404DRAFT_999550 [Pisolithus tinctorius Marx 270]|uniref:Uncharacterized protein n=1 Tax=Pisolithus tinctorius Marx 270 TaxID=870435 RepID=A0A0C3J9Z3_PISTI|nr:hypothetical protein M404DRAFT_999550 [Pisolithus tinctorius Marx 270]
MEASDRKNPVVSCTDAGIPSVSVLRARHPDKELPDTPRSSGFGPVCNRAHSGCRHNVNASGHCSAFFPGSQWLARSALAIRYRSWGR